MGWGRTRVESISEIREKIGLLNRTVLALLLDEFRDEAGPAGLVRGAEARADVTVKILVKQISSYCRESRWLP